MKGFGTPHCAKPTHTAKVLACPRLSGRIGEPPFPPKRRDWWLLRSGWGGKIGNARVFAVACCWIQKAACHWHLTHPTQLTVPSATGLSAHHSTGRANWAEQAVLYGAKGQGAATKQARTNLPLRCLQAQPCGGVAAPWPKPPLPTSGHWSFSSAAATVFCQGTAMAASPMRSWCLRHQERSSKHKNHPPGTAGHHHSMMGECAAWC